MKNMNKKGFTIVELVIVIAVIAILAAVMIPTFGGIISKARESAAVQQVSAAYKEAKALALADGVINGDVIEDVDGFTFTFTGDSSATISAYPESFGYTATISGDKVTVTANN